MKIKSTLLVASALLGMTSAVSLGQTNITDNNSYIKGTFKAANPTVRKGVDFASSIFERSASIATTIIQDAETVLKTNNVGFTIKGMSKKYSFGNKELLQLGLGTNNVTGYSLVVTNRFDGLSFGNTATGYAAKKGTNLTTVSSLRVDPVNSIVTYYDVAIKTNSPAQTTLKSNYKGFVLFNIDLGPFSGLRATAAYNDIGPKTVSIGTNKTTYIATSISGSISEFYED